MDLFVLLSCECYRVRVLEEVLEALPGRATATKSGKCPTLCQIATAVTRPRLPTLINSQPCHCGAAPTTQTDGCCCNTCSIRAANKPSRSWKFYNRKEGPLTGLSLLKVLNSTSHLIIYFTFNLVAAFYLIVKSSRWFGSSSISVLMLDGVRQQILYEGSC